MARKSTSPNGRDRLEEAMATLIQNQAAFIAQLAETNRAHLQFERETAERFASQYGPAVEPPVAQQTQPRFNAIDYAETGSTKSATVIIGPCDTHRP